MTFFDPQTDDEEDFGPVEGGEGDEHIEDVNDLDEGPGDLGDISDEDRARALGWKDREEYRGDPRRWTPAKEFLDRGDRELPILREQLKRTSDRMVRTSREMESLRCTVAEQAEAIRVSQELAKRADQRGYDRALRELKIERDAAVEAGDKLGFDQVQEQIDAMESERNAQPAPVERPPVDTPPAIDPAITRFISDNAWFSDKSRPYLNTAMVQFHNAVIQQHPEMPVAEQLEIALERMGKAYPEVAPRQRDEDMDEPRQPARPRPARRAPSALEPRGGDIDPSRRSRSPFDRIEDPTERADARKAFESVRRHDPDVSEAEYVDIYLDPHADVLDIQRRRRKA